MKNLLLQELLDYVPEGYMEAKARRVYYKCVAAGKMSIAYAILCKYNINKPVQSDMAVALGYSLMDQHGNNPMKDFNLDRALKLIRSNKLLKKLWDKVPRHQDKTEAARSIFNALIKGDRQLMSEYEKTV